MGDKKFNRTSYVKDKINNLRKKKLCGRQKKYNRTSYVEVKKIIKKRKKLCERQRLLNHLNLGTTFKSIDSLLISIENDDNLSLSKEVNQETMTQKMIKAFLKQFLIKNSFIHFNINIAIMLH